MVALDVDVLVEEDSVDVRVRLVLVKVAVVDACQYLG